MTSCFSLTEAKNGCFRSTFIKQGLHSTITDLKDGTVVHCWAPRIRTDSKPNLLLIHGLGANALWQWGDVIRHFTPYFNVYVPDLVFFGESFTTRPERTESFQAQCLMRVMEANSVRKLSLVGLSYGGFIGYRIAAEYKEAVERVAIGASGICMEEKDLREGVFPVSDLEEAAKILVPLKPEKLRELVGYTFFRPPPVGFIPDCFLVDFINVMCRDYVEEKKELIRAIPKERKLSNIPKITQPTLIIWGENDRVFQLELGCRLNRHLGDNAHLAIIKKAGHAFNVEKPKERYGCQDQRFLLTTKFSYRSTPQKDQEFSISSYYCGGATRMANPSQDFSQLNISGEEKEKLVAEVIRYVLFKTHQNGGCPIKREELTQIVTKSYCLCFLPAFVINEAIAKLSSIFGLEMRELQRDRPSSANQQIKQLVAL